jgi:hypothetical protein
MNVSAIPLDALNRFRQAASQYARPTKSRASRLLSLKEDIAALRKRGVSYVAISELLTQCGISASGTCVRRFCLRVLKERRRKPITTKRAASNPKPPAAPETKPDQPPKTTAPAAPTTTGDTFLFPTNPAVNAPTKSRGPRIAKIELINPK